MASVQLLTGAGIETILTVSVGPSTGSVGTQEVTAFDSLSLKFNFDTGDEIGFTTPASSAEGRVISASGALACDVWLEGALAQRYRVTGIDQTWTVDGVSVLAVTGLSYKRLLFGRLLHADMTFTQIDQGDILWSLIAHTQAQPGGTWGVTKGACTTGKLRDRTYVKGDNIGDLAGKLQDVIDGMYWTIDVNKVYSAKAATSITQHVQPLQLGMNARALLRRNTAATFANSVYATGDSATNPVWVDDAQIASDPRGRWETSVGFPTVIKQTTLQEHADGELRKTVSPRGFWTVALEPARWIAESHYLPGDWMAYYLPIPATEPPGTTAKLTYLQVLELAGSFTADGALDISMACVEML